MERWTLDPWPWIEGSIFGEGGRDPDQGLFHVTTRVDAVRASGGLKARRELGGIVALGGGPKNEAPDLVSFVYDRSRALWLYGAIHATARAARDQIDAVELVKLMFEWTGFPDDSDWSSFIDNWIEMHAEVWGEEQAETEMWGMLVDVGASIGVPEFALSSDSLVSFRQSDWLRLVDAHADAVRANLGSARAKYRAVQDFEQILSARFTSVDSVDSDLISCESVVGFTAPFDRFSKIDPDQVSVLQCEARIGANVDFEPSECELRFAPKDVRVVRYGVEKDGAIPLPDDEAAE